MWVGSVIYFFLSVSCVLCTGSGSDFWSVYSYDTKLHGFLKLHRDPVDWRAARTSCHMEGAFLVSTWTSEFSSSMYELLSISGMPALYSGFHTQSADGSYSYVKGKSAISPDTSGLTELERCGVFLANNTVGEVSCDQQLPYVCYVPASALTPVSTLAPTSPPTLAPITTPTLASTSPSYTSTLTAPDCGKSPGYRFESRTGHCYKFHSLRVGWYDAKRKCEEEDAYLAIINSDVEANLLLDLLKENNSTYLIVLSGFYINKSGVAKTLHGETLEKAGYTNGTSNFPYNFLEATCGFFCTGEFGSFCKSSGDLSYGYYLQKLPYICEKKPKTLNYFDRFMNFMNGL